MQVPLPETADELCAVARDLRVSGNDIRLGARATEAEIKRLSEAGEVSKYRVIRGRCGGGGGGAVGSGPRILLRWSARAARLPLGGRLGCDGEADYGAVDRMAADKRVGRAEAMRQSMLALIDKGTAYEAHPSYWAPFVVVGEGATAK